MPESKFVPHPKPRPAAHVAFIISDDAYADWLQGWSTLGERARKPKPKVEDIQRMVAHHYNIRRRDILSSRRTANVVRPRQVAMYLVRTLTLRSLPEIGRLFGQRDHTTVLHGVNRTTERMKTDRAFSATVAEFVRQTEEWAVTPRGETGG